MLNRRRSGVAAVHPETPHAEKRKVRAMAAITVTVWLATRRSPFWRAIHQKSKSRATRKSGQTRWCPSETALSLSCLAAEYRYP